MSPARFSKPLQSCPAALHRGLAHLQAAEFLYETSLFPDIEYTFKHALTQQVAYRVSRTSGGVLCTGAWEKPWSDSIRRNWRSITHSWRIITAEVTTRRRRLSISSRRGTRPPSGMPIGRPSTPFSRRWSGCRWVKSMTASWDNAPHCS